MKKIFTLGKYTNQMKTLEHLYGPKIITLQQGAMIDILYKLESYQEK